MLLAIDIGNSNIVIGIFDNNKLIKKWRIATDINKTPDEYYAIIKFFLSSSEVNIDGGIFSSVVPPLDKIFIEIFKNHFNIEPLYVSHKLNLGIKIKYKNPSEIGADRLVNATAGVSLFDSPLIIIDMGTATTFCYIDREKNYYGGLILPGVKLMRDSLHIKTAKLPEVDFIDTDWIIGENTVQSIQAGLYYLNVGGINYILDLLLNGYDNKSKIVITGGLANVIRKGIKYETIYEPDLTLKGLNIIYNLNVEDKK